MVDTFYADVSTFQAVADATYPHPMLAFRVDTGFGVDDHAAGNWRFCRTTDRIQVALAYVVFKPGQQRAIFDRVKGFFGDPAPAKLAVMIDVESGDLFAGPGDHSAGANELADLFAGWLGDRARVVGYANGFDWQNNWPTRPAWLKRVTAAYGTQDPGTFGWQFYGGVPDNPSPAGYPRSCPPFGDAVDLNVIHAPIGDIAAALGVDMPTTDEIVTAVFHHPLDTSDATPTTFAQYVRDTNADVAALRTAVAALSQQVAALRLGGVDPVAVAKAIATHLAVVTK